MAKVYKTALGRQIDVDSLMLKNEHVIAVGNQRVNARGDQLGPGGKIIKTRDQIMKEYYALKTPVAKESSGTAPQKTTSQTVAPDDQPVKAAITTHPRPGLIELTPEPINPNSGIDDDDEGPSVAPIVDAPLVFTPPPVVEVAQPAPALIPEPQTPAIEAVVHQAPPIQADDMTAHVVQPQPMLATFTPKSIPVGVPAMQEMVKPAMPDMMVDRNVYDKPPPAPEAPIRGALASAVHSQSTVTQKELQIPRKANGIQRF